MTHRAAALLLLAQLAWAPAAAGQSDAANSMAEARRLISEGRTAEAIAALRQIVRIDRRNAAAHSALGSMLNATGHYAEALPHAEAAAAIEPRNGRYRYMRGVVLAEHGRFAEAVSDFDLALAAHPDMAYAWLERGAARLALGQAEAAAQDWAQAREAAPDLIWTQWYPATAAILAGRYAEAAAIFDRVAEVEPAFLPARLWSVVAHGRAGRTPPIPTASGTEWPAPVLDYYRGGSTAEQLLTVAAEDRISGDGRRVGEALYFIGQYELIAGRRGSALRYFRRAIAVDAPRHVWKMSAERELQRLHRRR